ncbi:MAG: hypothetical protein KJZ98_00050 [Burkholderiaceae bacterium]|nr:hypothetical protein [Burkholderiaceae bacterium]MEB2352332.1 hypothetical protein [Burkholderiaceae bacterium]
MVRAALLLLFFAQCAVAQESTPILDGEPFTKRFVATPPNGDRVLEFVRAHESFEEWTKLIGYRYQQLPGIDNDPRKFAAGMARALQAANPQTQARVAVNGRTNEVMIDFLTWPPDRRFMEFNVFRLARSPDGKAVVSLQLAYRFAGPAANGAEKLRKVRDAWISQATAFDMRNAHAALGKGTPRQAQRIE